MTPEEMVAQLREAGIPVGERVDSEGRTVRSPLIDRQKEGLQKLEGLLEQQIEQDQMKVAELHAALQKLKHGGGTSRG